MPRTTATPKLIKQDLDRAWKLLNQLGEALSRISSDTDSLADTLAARPMAADKADGRRGGASSARKQGRGGASSTAAAEGLPDTTGDFFAKHVRKRKQTAPQIYHSVIGTLPFEPSKEQASILRNRLAVWLSNAAKSENSGIASEGTGKERRYYRS